MTEQRAARRAVTLYLEEKHIQLSAIHAEMVAKTAELKQKHPNDDYAVENVKDSYREIHVVLHHIVQRLGCL